MDVKNFLLQNKIEPRKNWDQFFLNNESILDQEIQLAELKSSDIVLEVGPGIGNLTRLIAQHARVIAVEKDKRFLPYLKIENIDVIYDDIIRLLKRKQLKFNKIVSNVPYSISKKLLLELLRHEWDLAVLMFQKEFVDKLLHGKYALLIEDCCEFKKICTVSRNSFYPQAVDSSLIVLKQKKIMDENLWKLINKLFRHKNKDVKNVVKTYPKELERKKIQHLTLEEIKKIHKD